ncbi:MAG: hypothetical protein IPP15_08740 [Saprospiraceae bacterium]|uniref:Uncharacterized protein n=1 Tax=Candidatus Opimibacter skivensis TaxID=2982028 RepID=A0A9D7XT92_9BACT|nr:hypothetical protein [Candidatus Opimibacter skivensis]
MRRALTFIRNVLRYHIKPFLPVFIISKLTNKFNQRDFGRWQKAGRPAPPPHYIKQMTIEEYQKKSGYTVLVESGTFLGDMVESQKKSFKRIVSIELSSLLFKKATKRFKNDPNVSIVHGDSGEKLTEILDATMEPVIFWLDGHYSSGITAKGNKECPVFEEIDAIFNSVNRSDHIILIDDARLFTGKYDYPEISRLTDYIQRKNEKYKVEVKDDIIRYWIH